ncbi:MAG: patatin-like phospholipase family protein [Thermotogaceae bacterium]|nr:patatin-like phospholipase family protein [Mesotoga sp.]MDD4478635.1 patatin-like phospholipase family protein [Mesotoga sp.]NLX33932.1 patatin-like phospholipase family protein [Thermotogaceae bacterium]HPI16610.1 patatin-like phospholipase family protein [Mesotoga sp.]
MKKSVLAILFLMILSLALSNVGLVLSGGGAKGGYEIGAWKALIDMDITIGGVYGTSVGSLNAAAVGQGDFGKALEVWRDISESKVMKPTQGQKTLIDAYGGSNEWSVGELFQGAIDIIKKGIDVSPLRELLEELISENTVRNSGIDFGLVTFDLTDLRPEMLFIEDIPEGKLIDYIMASADFPGFQTVRVDGKAFIDGGIYSNQPVEMALQRGFRNIVLVDIGRVALRDRIARFQAFVQGAEVTHIVPRIMYGSTLDFDPEKIQLQIEEGYLDTLAAFGLVTGEYTYIFEDRDVLEVMFDSLPVQKQLEAIEFIGDPARWPSPESFYEDFAGSLEKIYKLPMPTLVLLDNLARQLKIGNLMLYSTGEILKEIKTAYERDGIELPEESLIPYDRAVDFVLYLYENAPLPESPENFSFFKSSFDTLSDVKE